MNKPNDAAQGSLAVQAAAEAAEAIRQLNHETMPGKGGLEYPDDVYSVVACLRGLAERLPQALGQCGRWLEAEHAAGRVGHAAGADPWDAVNETRTALHMATAAANDLAAYLAAAHNASSHLTGKEDQP